MNRPDQTAAPLQPIFPIYTLPLLTPAIPEPPASTTRFTSSPSFCSKHSIPTSIPDPQARLGHPPDRRQVCQTPSRFRSWTSLSESIWPSLCDHFQTSNLRQTAVLGVPDSGARSHADPLFVAVPGVTDPRVHPSPPRVHPQDVLEAKVVSQTGVDHLHEGWGDGCRRFRNLRCA